VVQADLAGKNLPTPASRGCVYQELVGLNGVLEHLRDALGRPAGEDRPRGGGVAREELPARQLDPAAVAPAVGLGRQRFQEGARAGRVPGCGESPDQEQLSPGLAPIDGRGHTRVLDGDVRGAGGQRRRGADRGGVDTGRASVLGRALLPHDLVEDCARLGSLSRAQQGAGVSQAVRQRDGLSRALGIEGEGVRESSLVVQLACGEDARSDIDVGQRDVVCMDHE
jgi:hypothetical protein